jgi:hypothetical protein
MIKQCAMKEEWPGGKHLVVDDKYAYPRVQCLRLVIINNTITSTSGKTSTWRSERACKVKSNEINVLSCNPFFSERIRSMIQYLLNMKTRLSYLINVVHMTN